LSELLLLTKRSAKYCGLILIFLLTFGLRLLAQETAQASVIEIESKARELSREWNGKAIHRAVNLYLEASQKWNSTAHKQKAADCLRKAARLLQLLGDYKAAGLQLNKALTLDRQIGNLPGEAESLSLFSMIKFQEGDIKASQKLFLQALKISANANSDEAQAWAFLSAGEFNYSQAGVAESITSLQKSLYFAERSTNPELLAQVLLYLSYAYIKNGDWAPALETANRSFAKWKDIGDLRGQAITYVAIGTINTQMDEKQDALKAFHQAEAIFAEDIDLLYKARLYNGIAAIYGDYERWDLAYKYHQKAFELFKRSNYPVGQLATLPSIVKINYLLEKDDLAEINYQEALALSQKLNDVIYIGFLQEIVGNHKLEKGFVDEALTYFEKGLNDFRKINFKRGIALIHGKLGQTYEVKGQTLKARKAYSDSLIINREIKNKFAEAQIHQALARLNWTENNANEALQNIEKSLELTETLYSEVANSSLKRSYFSNVYDRYELYIHLAMQKQRETSDASFSLQALRASEKARSRSLLETLRLSEADFIKDADPELVKREKELASLLNSKTDKLTALLSSKSERSEIEKIEDEIRTITNELEEISARFKQESPIYSAVKNPPPFDIVEFQQNILDEQTVLLEFSLGERESYLWVVEKNEVTHYVLPARKIIEGRVEHLRRALEEREKSSTESIEAYQRRLSGLEEIFNREAALLSCELLGQVSEKIDGKRLIVVPDGKLHYLPLTALPSPNSTEPLMARHEIVYEPSATLLSLLGKIPPKAEPQKDLLIFADPVFNDSDPRLTAKTDGEAPTTNIFDLNLRDFRLTDGNGKIPRLFASQDEALSIQNILGQAKTVIAAGFEASRERVLNSDIADYRILHFATHGLVDVERPEVSGIVLSQYDENAKKREGFLRLQDIYALDLSADLVVLSACRSGVGKEVKGEGLLSLNNAFLHAGAKSVISSAWKVDDYATAELMKFFYQELSERQIAPSEALRRAQLRMRENPQFSSPFYWAAFTVQGEYRHAVLRENTGYGFYLGAIVLLLLLLGLYWKFKASRA
jgi:CHAT domain-containing protein